MAKVKLANIPSLNFKDIGNCYTHTELGITYPQTLKSFVKVGNEKYLFISINNKKKYRNELHSDGVVYEPKDVADLIKCPSCSKATEDKGMHIMVRFHTAGSYMYVGDQLYIGRYDRERNKVFIKDIEKI